LRQREGVDRLGQEQPGARLADLALVEEGRPEGGVDGSVHVGVLEDYVRALAELTKNLSSLTPAVSAFVVSTILFITAGTTVALNSI
jgi:hypothetical protein